MTIRSQAGRLYLNFSYPVGEPQREALKLDDTPKNRKVAEKLDAQIKLSIKAGSYKRSDFFEDGSPKTGTILEFSEYWLSVIDVEERTFRNYKSSLKTLNKAFGKYNLKDLKPLMIQAWIKNSNYASKTIRNYLGILSVMYNSAIDNDLALTNPVSKVTLPKKESPEGKIRPFTTNELAAIFKYLFENEPELGNLVLFMTETGLRPSECFVLTYADLDLVNNSVRIYKSMDLPPLGSEPGTLKLKGTKTDKTRHVSLTEYALSAITGSNLKPIENREGFIFLNPRTGDLWDSAHINGKLWVKTLKACQIDSRPLYNCRHTFGSSLVSAGLPMKYVSQQLGHSNTAVTEQFYATFMQAATDDLLKVRNSARGAEPLLKLVSNG